MADHENQHYQYKRLKGVCEMDKKEILLLKN